MAHKSSVILFALCHNPKDKFLIPALQKEEAEKELCSETGSVVHNWWAVQLGMESEKEVC